MSIHAMSHVWATSTQTGGNLLLLLALADYANDRGECWPSVDTLARKARVTDRHARRILRELVDAGELEIRTGAGRNGVNVYRLRGQTEKDTLQSLCPLCHKKIGPGEEQAHSHHIVPLSEGGSDRKSNKVRVCETCHVQELHEGVDRRLTELGTVLRDHGISAAAKHRADKMSADKTGREGLTFEASRADAHVSQTIRNHHEPSRTAADASAASAAFVSWFVELLERTGATGAVLRPSTRAAWVDAYEQLVASGETDATIRQACENARGDSFWRTRFLSPVQLTRWNRAGVAYVHVFANLTLGEVAASMDEERVRLEREMTAILRPGGCAYNVAPTGEKLERFNRLKAEHTALLGQIRTVDRKQLHHA